MKKQKEHICLVKWRKRLDAAEKRGRFTEYEENLAGSWDVCAVGEGKQQLNKSIVTKAFIYDSEFLMNAPVDRKLLKLGVKFANYVDSWEFCDPQNCECGCKDDKVFKKNLKNARLTLDKIEKRLNELYVVV
jgi:hypothetical protein